MTRIDTNIAEKREAMTVSATAPCGRYRIEGAPRDDVADLYRWEVYQYSDGEEYEVSGGVNSEEEARAIVEHFRAHGSPRINTMEWCRAYRSVEGVLLSMREAAR